MQLANLYVLYVILSHFDEAKDEDPICLLKEAGAWLGIYVFNHVPFRYIYLF